MSKRTLRNGTIVHKREGAPVPFVPQLQTNPGVDPLELLRPERAVERLEAENAALTRQRDEVADQAQRYAVETIGLADRIAALTREVAGLRATVAGLREVGAQMYEALELCADILHDATDGMYVGERDARVAMARWAALAATTDTKETTDGTH